MTILPSSNLTKPRDIYPDILKGLLMFLVVFGHSIQYLRPKAVEQGFWDDSVWLVIYAFHMPLFFIISAYFLAKTVNRHRTYDILIRRFWQLIVPCILWGGLVVGLKLGLGISPWGSIKIFLTDIVKEYWFLPTLFELTAVVLFVRHFLRDHWLAYTIIGIIALVFPLRLPFVPYNFMYSCGMYPYFIGTYLLVKYDCISRLSARQRAVIAGVSLAIFLCAVHFFKGKYTIYCGYHLYNAKKWTHQFLVDAYRFILGSVGTIAFAWLIHQIARHTKVQHLWVTQRCALIGQGTLGIYLTQHLIFTTTLAYSIDIPCNYAIWLLCAIGILGFCLITTRLLRHSKYTRWIIGE